MEDNKEQEEEMLEKWWYDCYPMRKHAEDIALPLIATTRLIERKFQQKDTGE